MAWASTGDDDADYDEGIDIATLPGPLFGMDERLEVATSSPLPAPHPWADGNRQLR